MNLVNITANYFQLLMEKKNNKMYVQVAILTGYGYKYEGLHCCSIVLTLILNDSDTGRYGKV